MNDQKFNMKQLQDIIGQITDKMKQLHKSIAKIKEQVEPVIKQYQQNISSAVKSLEVNSQTKQSKLIAFSRAFATGGVISGYGGGDRVPAWLEAGEFVIRKEAVKKYGAKIFTALNTLTFDRDTLENAMQTFISPLANMVEEHKSKRMAFNFPDLENLPTEKTTTINLTINKQPIGNLRGSEDVIDKLVTALRRERLTTIR